MKEDFDVTEKPLTAELRSFIKPARTASWLAVFYLGLEVVQQVFETLFYVFIVVLFMGVMSFTVWEIYTNGL